MASSEKNSRWKYSIKAGLIDTGNGGLELVLYGNSHGNASFFVEGSIFEDIAFVMFCPTPNERDLYFDQRALEIDFRWNERQPLFFYLERETEYVLSLEQQFPVSRRGMVESFGFSFVGADMGRDEHGSPARQYDVGTPKVHSAAPYAFYFGPVENYARLQSLQDFVVKEGFFILRDSGRVRLIHRLNSKFVRQYTYFPKFRLAFFREFKEAKNSSSPKSGQSVSVK